MAADPHTPIILGGAGAVAALSGVMGPVAAEWSVVLVAAIIGAAIAARDSETKTAGAVWWLILRGVGMSLAFTSIAARLLAGQIAGMAPADLLWPLAVLIAWKQDRLAGLLRFLPTKRDPP